MEPLSPRKTVCRGDYQYAPVDSDYGYRACPECAERGLPPVRYFAGNCVTSDEVEITADQFAHPERYPNEPWWREGEDWILNAERCDRCGGSGEIYDPDRDYDPDGYED